MTSPVPNHSPHQLLRQVHESTLYTRCLITQKPKNQLVPGQSTFPFRGESDTLVDPPNGDTKHDLDEVDGPNQGKLDHVKVSQDRFVWVDLTHRRATIDPEIFSRLLTLLEKKLKSLKDTPFPSPTRGESGTRTRPLDHEWCMELLELASFSCSKNIPALVTPLAKERNRFRGNGFVNEKYRIPLALYSKKYLEQISSNYFDYFAAKNNKAPVTNDPLPLDKLTPVGSFPQDIYEQTFKCKLDSLAWGDYVNASDIIPPILFRQQLLPHTAVLNDETYDMIQSIEKFDGIVCLDDLITLPPRILEKKSFFSVPKTTYIGTHFPTEETIDIFYQNLYEQRVRMVVALTTEEAYWPVSSVPDLYPPASGNKPPSLNDHFDFDDDRYAAGYSKPGDKARYGNFVVRIDKVEIFRSDTVIARHVTIIHDPIHFGNQISDVKPTPTNHTKCVLFQYTDWPDMGVPDGNSFIEFYRVFSKYRSSLEKKYTNEPGYATRPIASHCLAGIGRAGTFIIVDILIQAMKAVLKVAFKPGNVLDAHETGMIFHSTFYYKIVPYVLLALRSCRRGIVQTPVQVCFIAKMVDDIINSYLREMPGKQKKWEAKEAKKGAETKVEQNEENKKHKADEMAT
jgi:protein tyrosine phosphatase